MKKTWIVPGVIIGLIVILILLFVGKYNSLVAKDEGVKTAWGQVQNVYQRRADLIPNLVETVKGYATHEEQTLTEVTEARAKATSITVTPANAEQMAQFQNAQTGLTSALGKLLAISENYPDLKANQNFLELQAQLEGAENRITTERMRYNQTVQDYNTYLRSFPTNIVANWFGFEKATVFQADAGADKVPQVKF